MALTVATVAAMIAVVPTVVASGPAGATTCLGATATNVTLSSGQCLVDGNATLQMQATGNLVSYYTTPGSTSSRVVWSSTTSGTGNYFATGNAGAGTAAIYGASGNVITSYGFQPGDHVNSDTALSLQTTGNVLLQATTGSGAVTTWQSGTATGQVPFTLLLTAGMAITSPSGNYRLIMQTDGNLVLYYEPASLAIWNSRTDGHAGAYADLQTDGNLVVMSATGRTVLWNAGSGAASPVLMLQDDGDLVVYGTNTTGQYAAWSSGTEGDRGTTLRAGQDLQAGQYLQSETAQYRLAMSSSGVLVLYQSNPYACPLWSVPAVASTTSFSTTPAHVTGAYLTVGGSGDVAAGIYRPGSNSSPPALWSVPGTAGTSGSTDRLVVQADGNVVLYGRGNAVLWSSGTQDMRGSVLCTGTTLSSGQYLVPWTTGKPTGAGNRLTMQSTCNLVLYQAGTALWASNTDIDVTEKGEWGETTTPTLKADGYYAGCHVTMQATGNLVMTSTTGYVMWQSGTTQSTTPHFDAAGLGPYLAVPVTGSNSGLDVATSHGKLLGSPDPAAVTSKKTVFKILGDVFDGLSLVLTFVADPVGAYTGSSAFGIVSGLASIGTDFASAANSYKSAGKTTSAGDGSQLQPGVIYGYSTCTDRTEMKWTAELQGGGCLASDGGTYKLLMQTDGNLVLYWYGGHPTGSPTQVMWASNTANPTLPPGYARTVLTPTHGITVIAPYVAATFGTGGTDLYMVLQNNGEFQEWNGTPSATGSSLLWQTTTSATPVSACTPATAPQVLATGQTMQPTSCLVSPNGQYELQMQADGNLVEYLANPREALWSSHTTTHRGAVAYLAPGGDLEITPTPKGAPYWQSATSAAYGLLTVQNDGNVVLYGSNGKVSVDAVPYAVWQTGTSQARGTTLGSGEVLMPGQYLESANGQYKLTMGTTGLLELTYAPTQTPQYICPMWTKPTAYATRYGDSYVVNYTVGLKPGTYLIMQTDGNLVVSEPTASKKPIFDTGTSGYPGSSLVLETTGSMLVQFPGANGSTTTVWPTTTSTKFGPETTAHDRGTALCTGARLYGQYPTGKAATQFIQGLRIGTTAPRNRTVFGKLVMQHTCNLVYYAQVGTDGWRAEWASDTDITTGSDFGSKYDILTPTKASHGGYNGCYVIMQSTGNLVMRANDGTVMWQSGSAQSKNPPQLVKNLGPYSLIGLTAGYTESTIEIVSDQGTPIWHSSNDKHFSGGAATVVQGLLDILVFLVG